MQLEATTLEGLFLVRPKVFDDARGLFVKYFHEEEFRKSGIHFRPAEEYYSVSSKDVLRGMHFQAPPHDHGKLVYCSRGKILDVVLDLRKSRPTFGRTYAVELSGENRLALFIPKGMAHGFLSLDEGSVMHYAVETVYAPGSDSGIRWDSIGFDWPCENPVVSGRDGGFPLLDAYRSPFE